MALLFCMDISDFSVCSVDYVTPLFNLGYIIPSKTDVKTVQILERKISPCISTLASLALP